MGRIHGVGLLPTGVLWVMVGQWVYSGGSVSLNSIVGVHNPMALLCFVVSSGLPERSWEASG